MSDRELLTECLDVLTHDAAQRTFAGGVRMSQLAIKLRAHLAAPRPEPVAWMYVNSEGECEQIEYGTEAIDDDSITLLYAAPPTAAPIEDIEALRRENERLREENRLWYSRAVALFWRGDSSKITVGRLQLAAKEIDAALQEVPR